MFGAGKLIASLIWYYLYSSSSLRSSRMNLVSDVIPSMSVVQVTADVVDSAPMLTTDPVVLYTSKLFSLSSAS
jgi:hypothetical protein